VSLGTMLNALSVYPLVRIGKMSPYFNGFMNQYITPQSKCCRRRNKIQAYLMIRPEIQLVYNNTLLEGGLFADSPGMKFEPRAASVTSINNSQSSVRRIVNSISYGIVVSEGKFCISFTQNSSTELKKGTYSHEVGNISMYFCL